MITVLAVFVGCVTQVVRNDIQLEISVGNLGVLVKSPTPEALTGSRLGTNAPDFKSDTALPGVTSGLRMWMLTAGKDRQPDG